MPKKSDTTDHGVAVRWEHDEEFDTQVGYCADGSVWAGEDTVPVAPEPEPPAEPEAPPEPAPEPPK